MMYLINRQNLISTVNSYSVNARVYYPYKANTNCHVVQILDPLIAGYEVASIYHLIYLITKRKVEPQRILYSAPIKSNSQIKRALSLGVNNIVVDNIDELERIIRLANNNPLNIILRVDISNFINAQQSVFKWGASINEILYMKDMLANSAHQYMGLNFYIPQEVDCASNFVTVIDGIANTIGVRDCKVIDIGGGISSADVESILTKIKVKYDLGGVDFIVEPGRHLLNPNIDLIVKIIDIRAKQGQKLVFIDSGIYSGLMDAVIKNRRFKISYINNKKRQLDERVERCLICGDSSDISDVLGIYDLPKNIRVGDELIISECGSYCSELDTDFCKNKRANYYIVDS